MRIRSILFLTILVLFISSCNQQGGLALTSNTVTTDMAQRAVDKAIEGLKQQYRRISSDFLEKRIVGKGKATVTGVQDRPQENIAIASITYTDLAMECGGHEDWSSGQAIFTHYNDGRWVLTKLITGGMWCTPAFNFNIEVK